MGVLEFCDRCLEHMEGEDQGIDEPGWPNRWTLARSRRNASQQLRQQRLITVQEGACPYRSLVRPGSGTLAGFRSRCGL
jgi:hypothetical protein